MSEPKCYCHNKIITDYDVFDGSLAFYCSVTGEYCDDVYY